MIGGKIKIFIMVLIVCISLSSCSRRYGSEKDEDYAKYLDEVANANLHMPDLEDLGDYKSISVSRRTCNDIFIDTTETISLIVQYGKDDFNLAIDQIETRYEFVNSALDNYEDYEAEVHDYYFRVDSNSLCEMVNYPSGETVLVPKCSLIIGINEIKNKIAYLYYWDIEIQEMDDLDKFIEEKFVF